MNEIVKCLQTVQLEILKDVAVFCERNQIRYYLTGGTLLGAIKYEGFIPWDDDIDIAMYREDYNKFIQKFTQENGDKYFVQNNYTDKEYSRFITKIRLNGTKQVEESIATVKMHHGIYIDIFPLDNVKKSKGVSMMIRGFLLRTFHIYSTIRAGKRDFKSRKKDMIKKMLRVFTFLIPRAFVNRAFDYVCTMSNGKNYEYTTSFLRRDSWKKETVKNEVYGIGKKVLYEGLFLNAPSKPEVILEQVYGDYMKEPSIDQQVSGHNLVEVEFGEYKRIIDDKYSALLSMNKKSNK